MKLTAGQAAKATGKSIPTIVRAYDSGRLSGEKLPDGKGYLFEPSELFRVFPPIASPSQDTASLGDETPFETGGLQAELAVLREKLRLLETYSERERESLVRQVADLRQQVEDTRKDRDHWRDTAEASLRRLPAPAAEQSPAPPPAVAERPSLLARLFGTRKS